STKPTIATFKGPHTNNCNINSTVHLTWTSTNTTGVRLAIDYPVASEGYANYFMDYPSNGSADVPYSCDFTLSDSGGYYHLYTLITLHKTGGYYSYRIVKVYALQ